jgi:uncharacterized membrane protein
MYGDWFMKTMLKVLLAVGVAGLVIGIPVTFSHAQMSPLWTLALPVGVTFLGLFLITYLWRNELAKFDAEERAKAESASRHPTTSADGAPPAPRPSASQAGL